MITRQRYRRLNKNTQSVALDELQERSRMGNIFSKCDLTNGFYHLRWGEVRYGRQLSAQNKSPVLPFGFWDAPST